MYRKAKTPQIASKAMNMMTMNVPTGAPISLGISVFAMIAAMARSIITTHPVCSVEFCISTSYPCDTNTIVSNLVRIVNMPLHFNPLLIELCQQPTLERRHEQIEQREALHYD